MDRRNAQDVCKDQVFQKVFFALGERIRNFLYIRCGDRSLAEDLTQETFLRLWKACRKVSPEKAKSFLFTVANRLFLDEVKANRVRLRYKQQSQPSPAVGTDPHELFIQEEFRLSLIQAINNLPEKNRTVFLLNRVEKLTYKEIAAALDISVKAVEKRMHKALILLREAMPKE